MITSNLQNGSFSFQMIYTAKFYKTLKGAI